MTQILACPVCRLPLELDPATLKLYKCANSHTFDIAKQGYVNLLLSQQQGSKELGDSKEMLSRRRQFLDSGLYNGISDSVNKLVAHSLEPLDTKSVVVLDAGCGEGFYIKRLKDFLFSRYPELEVTFAGVDISKSGIQYATRRDKDIIFVVASVAALPVLDQSLDFIINVFSPVNYADFSRVLKPGGTLLTVKAGPRHLYALRQLLYTTPVEPLQDKASAKFGEFFRLSYNQEVSYEIELSSTNSILDLLLMTPYSWNIDPEAKTRLLELNYLQTQVDTLVRLFEKL